MTESSVRIARPGVATEEACNRARSDLLRIIAPPNAAPPTLRWRNYRRGGRLIRASMYREMRANNRVISVIIDRLIFTGRSNGTRARKFRSASPPHVLRITSVIYFDPFNSLFKHVRTVYRELANWSLLSAYENTHSSSMVEKFSTYKKMYSNFDRRIIVTFCTKQCNIY